MGWEGVEPTMFTTRVTDLQSVVVATGHTIPKLKQKANKRIATIAKMESNHNLKKLRTSKNLLFYSIQKNELLSQTYQDLKQVFIVNISLWRYFVTYGSRVLAYTNLFSSS